MKISDTELVLQAQQGDMDAFEQLVQRYDRKVLSLALRFTQNQDNAWDIYQESFLKVFRGLPGFRFESRFSTWLYRIVTNACLSQVRSERRFQFIPLEEWRDDGPMEGDPFPKRAVTSGWVTPEASQAGTYRREIAERIEAALATLSPQQRLVFILRHFEELKLKDIAELLHCAEGTVKNHLFHACERMRLQLREVYTT